MYDKYKAQVPLSVREWAGMRRTNSLGKLPPESGLFSLVHINDKGEHDFDQIADVIEEHWRYL